MNNNQESGELDLNEQKYDFENLFSKKIMDEPYEIQVPLQKQLKFSTTDNGDTLHSLVSNIRIEKQTAGRIQRKKKVQWNDKNTKLFLQYFQQFSGNLEMITREFQQSKVLGQEVDIKQIRNKYKIEKKKDTLSLSKQSQKIKKDNNLD